MVHLLWWVHWPYTASGKMRQQREETGNLLSLYAKAEKMKLQHLTPVADWGLDKGTALPSNHCALKKTLLKFQHKSRILYAEQKKLQIAEFWSLCLWWDCLKCGIYVYSSLLRNEEIHSRLNIRCSIIGRIQNKRLRYFGHLNRMQDERYRKIAYNDYVHGVRKRERPKNNDNNNNSNNNNNNIFQDLMKIN